MSFMSWSRTYTQWVLGHRYTVVAVLLSISAVQAYGIRFLEFDSSYQAYFRSDNPELIDFEKLQETYSRTDSIVVVLAPDDGKVFSPATLTAVWQLTRAGWEIPYTTRVDSITNFQYTTVYGDELYVRDLVSDPAALDDATIHRVREIALNEPLLVDRLLSPSAHVTAVYIGLLLPGGDSEEAVRSVAEVERVLDNLALRFPHIESYLTGGAVMDVEFPRASMNDITTLVPLVFLVILVSMLLLLRSAVASLITMLVIGLASISGMGLAGWLGMTLNPTSVGAATIIATLAVADSIHILNTLLQRLRTGDNKASALGYSLQHNFRPVFLTTVTTVIGFLSMNVSESPPFNDLGNITAMGIVAAFVFSVLLLPALVGILPIRVSAGTDSQIRIMTQLAEWVVRRRNLLLVGFSIVAVSLASLIGRIEIDDRFVEYFSKSNAFRQATDFTAQHLTGIYAIEYSLDSRHAFGVHDPGYLNAVDRFSNWLYQQPEVIHVNSIIPIIKRLNQNMHADDRTWYRIPESRELVAQYILMYELSLPYGLDLTNQLSMNKSASRLTLTLRNLSTSELRYLEQRIAIWLQRNAPTIETKATGTSIMFSVLSERNIRTMLASTALAVVLITLTLVVALRSLRLGLLSLVPNVLPMLMAFGVWAVFVGSIGLVVSVISAIVLGIIVDDTVHFLSRYQDARHVRQLSIRDAVVDTFAHVGTAIWITSAVLASGFSLLALSDFTLSSETGLISALTILFALFADLFFLPPLLILVDKLLPPVAPRHVDANVRDHRKVG